MRILSIKNNPIYLEIAIKYFQSKWANDASMMVYEDCLKHTISAKNNLPQWYLLLDGEDNIAGCAGLITNDFISRMDLFPWVCALYIEESFRGNSYGYLLLNKAKEDAKEFGYESLYLCTDHVNYYEKYDFFKIGTGYHPWGQSSSIYECKL